MPRTSALKSLIAFLLFLAVPAAQAGVLTFDGPDFQHGTVVDDEYDSIVTISADNFTNNVDLAVAFDSAQSPTADDDLEAPFFPNQAELDQYEANLAAGAADPTAGLNPFNPGNILIIQENNTGCATDGICDSPDDEGTNFTNDPTGRISFEFKQTIELLSIDFFDVESQENGNGSKNRIDIWDADTNAITTVGNTPDTGGDNLWQQVLFDPVLFPGLKNVRRIDVYFAGSGALDNLVYKEIPPVPVPAAVWLFGTALIGFIGYSRRTAV